MSLEDQGIWLTLSRILGCSGIPDAGLNIPLKQAAGIQKIPFQAQPEKARQFSDPNYFHGSNLVTDPRISLSQLSALSP